MVLIIFWFLMQTVIENQSVISSAENDILVAENKQKHEPVKNNSVALFDW